MERFVIRDSIAGNEIKRANTIEEAKKIISMYILDDIAEGTANEEADGKNYEDDFDEDENCFYELYDSEENKTINISKLDI